MILTGFMGTGKTVVGRLLAARLGYGFLDTDEAIVSRDGRAVHEIFRGDGEAAFRRWERIISRELAGKKGLVIATGGRLMLDGENEKLLARDAFVFCLAADPDEILARVRREKQARPLLDVPNPAQRIRELLAEREEGYGRFPQINTGGKTPQEIVEEIVQCIFATLKSEK